MFRGVVKRRGKQVPTSWVEDPYQAARDYIAKRDEVDAKLRAQDGLDVDPWPTATLAQALDAAIELARSRGCQPITIRQQWMTERKALCRLIGAQTVMATLGVDGIVRFVADARAEGRSDTTILSKDFFTLEQAFRAVGLPSPVPAARKAITNLRLVSKPPDPLTLAEVRNLIDRMRAWDPKECPAARRDADIFELTLYTGLRAGEWERLRRQDIDLARLEIAVAEPKNRARPRTLPVRERLRPVLERLYAEADPETGLLIPGGMQTIGTIGRKWRERLREPRMHGLRTFRHCLASALAADGTSIPVISLLLGHTSTATTAIYLHVLEGAKSLRRAVEGLD